MKIIYIVIACILITNISCKKSDFLAKKPSASLVIPSTLEDYQAILDEPNLMNGRGNGIVPALGESASDNFYVIASSTFITELTNDFYKNIYTWSDNLYQDQVARPNDWGFGYRSILYANVVLDGLSQMKPSDDKIEIYNSIKGSALFFRAHMHYQLAQVFAPHYDDATAKSQLGIPLKIKSDINEPVIRSSLETTYNQVITDLTEAVQLLPVKSATVNRPNKPAAFALLARVYQTMNNHEKALEFSTKCLELKNDLLDFNNSSLIPNPNATFPLPTPLTNPEILFYANLIEVNMQLLDSYSARIDSTLYKSYHNDDLRKVIFAKDAVSFYNRPGDRGYFFGGSYDKTEKLFAGLATDEVYLIRAEAYARLGEVQKSLADLNTLLKKRWSNKVPYPEVIAQTKDEALRIVLEERRKELLLRGLRWTDLRRLNKEGANITITRVALGQTYTLPAGDNRYTFLIPKDVMEFNTTMEQNRR